MGNVFQKSPDMAQPVGKVKVYERKPIKNFVSDSDAQTLTVTDEKQKVVMITTREGEVYRIEREPSNRNDSDFKQICRKGNYRIVLVPRYEMYKEEWSHVGTVKKMSAYLKLQDLFDAACRDPGGSQQLLSDDGSDQMVSRVCVAARPKWHEASCDEWKERCQMGCAVVTGILMLIVIAVLGFVYFWPVLILIVLIIMVVHLAVSRLKIMVGVGCAALWFCYVLYFFFGNSSSMNY